MDTFNNLGLLPCNLSSTLQFFYCMAHEVKPILIQILWIFLSHSLRSSWFINTHSFDLNLVPKVHIQKLTIKVRIFSHVASSGGSRFHLIKLSSTNLDPLVTQQLSKIASGSNNNSTSSAIGGKSEIGVMASPTFFFLRGTRETRDVYENPVGVGVCKTRCQSLLQWDMVHRTYSQVFDRLFCRLIVVDKDAISKTPNHQLGIECPCVWNQLVVSFGC